MRKIPREIIRCACGCETILEDRNKHGRKRKYVSGHNGRKYTNKTQYKREWNHRNRKSRYEYKKRYHRVRRLKLLDIFGNKCEDCQVAYNGSNAAIFHFHHLDPATKLFDIGNKITVRSWESILQEAEKCVMICANCHELKHGVNY